MEKDFQKLHIHPDGTSVKMLAVKPTCPSVPDAEASSSTPTNIPPQAPVAVCQDYVVGMDILDWFDTLELATSLQAVPTPDMVGLLLSKLPKEGFSAVMALDPPARREYASVKAAVIQLFGKDPEEYRKLFKDFSKSHQSWDEWVCASRKHLNGWVKGSGVTTFQGLLDLMMKGHLLDSCSLDLRLHLLDTKFESPRELALAADQWAANSTHGKDELPLHIPLRSQLPLEAQNKKKSVPQEPSSKRGSQKGNVNKAAAPRFKKENQDNPRGPCSYCKSPDPKSNGATSPKKAQAEDDTHQVGFVFTAITLRETAVPPSKEEWKDDPRVFSSFPQSIMRKLRVNGMPVTGLITTGSCHTRLHARFICPAQYLEGESITVQNPDGIKTFPRAWVSIEVEGITVQMKVTVCEPMVIGCLLGQDILPLLGPLKLW